MTVENVREDETPGCYNAKENEKFVRRPIIHPTPPLPPFPPSPHPPQLPNNFTVVQRAQTKEETVVSKRFRLCSLSLS